MVCKTVFNQEFFVAPRDDEYRKNALVDFVFQWCRAENSLFFAFHHFRFSTIERHDENVSGVRRSDDRKGAE